MIVTSGATLGDGRYRLDERLGAGGMAAVWLARDLRLERPVAVKLIADALADDPQWSERFLLEARALAAVTHPNVVDVFDYGLEDGDPYLVMAYVDGADLSKHLEGGGPLPAPPRRLATELLGALGAVHATGIVHRDVKAANVLVDRAGHVRLADFGIARTSDAASLTQTGMVVGTLRYLAPEIVEGRAATAASDLYSAGVVVRELATASGSAPELARLADALTQPDPADRPASAAEALLHLDPAAVDATAPMTAPTALADPTAPTRVGVLREDRTAPAPVRRAPAPGARPSHAGPVAPTPRPRRIPRRAVLVALLVLAVAVAILVLGRGSAGGPPAVDDPAAGDAPISTQVDTMRTMVDQAAGK